MANSDSSEKPTDTKAENATEAGSTPIIRRPTSVGILGCRVNNNAPVKRISVALSSREKGLTPHPLGKQVRLPGKTGPGVKAIPATSCWTSCTLIPVQTGKATFWLLLIQPGAIIHDPAFTRPLFLFQRSISIQNMTP